MLRKQVAHGAPRDSQERAPGQAAKEPGDEHSSDVLSHGLWDYPDGVGCPRDDIDGPSTIELAQGTQEHWSQTDSQDEKRQPQCRDDSRVAELGLHLLIG